MVFRNGGALRGGHGVWDGVVRDVRLDSAQGKTAGCIFLHVSRRAVRKLHVTRFLRNCNNEQCRHAGGLARARWFHPALPGEGLHAA